MKKCMLILLLLAPFASIAQQIVVQGAANFTYNDADIDPGEDLSSDMESADKINLDVKKLQKNAYWSITVSKNDINWNNSIKIYVRRTTDGNGAGSVWGGQNYIQINNVPSNFLNGYEKLNNIYLQYKISGVDVTLPADSYYTDIVYTLYEN